MLSHLQIKLCQKYDSNSRRNRNFPFRNNVVNFQTRCRNIGLSLNESLRQRNKIFILFVLHDDTTTILKNMQNIITNVKLLFVIIVMAE